MTPADRSYNIGPSETKEDRTRLFEQAFTAETALPKPNHNNWRVNNSRASRLSFQELMLLNEFVEAGVPYQDLPSWVIDSGVLEVDRDEKKKQERLTKETGLDLTQRKTLFNALQARTEALAELSENPLVRDTDVLINTFDMTAEKFGLDAVMTELKDRFPNAAKYFDRKLMVRNAEAAAKRLKDQQEADTRAEMDAVKTQLMVQDLMERGVEVND